MRRVVLSLAWLFVWLLAAGRSNADIAAATAETLDTGVNANPEEPAYVEYRGEFGYELLAILPWAYYKFAHGQLSKTVSCGDMSAFYFWDPKHTDKMDCVRDYIPLPKYVEWDRGLHLSRLPRHWLPPPIARHYRCKPPLVQRNGNKPLIIVFNKYTSEHQHPPVNFISVGMLRRIFQLLTTKFTVVYNRAGSAVTEDNSKLLAFPDEPMIRGEFPSEVIILRDIAERHGITFNEAQLRVMSQASYFITVQGGTSILASYFGGRNIVVCKGVAGELKYNSFARLFPFINRSWIQLVTSESQLESTVREMVNKPLIPPNDEVVDERTVALGLQGCDRDPNEFAQEAPLGWVE
eukprot:jgi/Chlat1/5288/Chrsp35S05241